MKRIAFFVGANTHFNVKRVISNHGWMLSDDFALDLVTTSPEAYMPAATDYYAAYGGGFPENHVGHAMSLWKYLRKHSPDVAVPATRPVIYGSLMSPFAIDESFEYVYRHSGEIFKYYESLEGWKKLLCYGVRNVGGNLSLTLADRYVALGPAGKRALVQKGIEPDLITILPPTISSDRFDLDGDEVPAPIKNVDRDIVLFLGRRTRMKGIHVLDEVIPTVLDERDDLHFVFVGGGGRVPDVRPSAHDHITVVGGVPAADVPSYLRAADILVLPSLSEGVPRVLLEALYMGTPVLANDVGDVSQVTDNTYRCRTEFARKLVNYEALPLDSIDSYRRSTAKEKYVDFFWDVVG